MFGGLWGAAEVGLGTLLHAMHVGHTGQVLTFIGIAILGAERRLCPARGISLATGTIASLCKSLSMAGVIAGPMVAIFMEGLLFEAATLAAPRSRPLAALGGALAMGWTGTQGFLRQLLFFGTAVIEIYLTLLKKAGDFLHVDPLYGWVLLAAIAAVLLAFGATAAEVGRALGDAALESRRGGGAAADGAAAAPEAAAPARAAPVLRATAVPVWPIALAAFVGVFASPLEWAIVSLAVLFAALAVRQPGSARRVLRPGFVALGVFFAAAGGLWLGAKDGTWHGVPFSSEGLRLGARMFLRGFALLAGITYVARGDAPRLLAGLARRVGLGPLADATGRAFAMVPEYRGRLGRARDLWRAPEERWTAFPRRLWALARDLVSHAASRAEDLATREADARPAVRFAISGPPGSGKTAALLAIVERLRRDGHAVGGFVQPARFGASGKEGYDLRLLATGETRPLASARAAGGYDFDDRPWAWAAERIARDAREGRVLVVDEIGRREADGGGHLPGLLAALREHRPRFLLCGVRDTALAPIVEHLGSFDAVWSPGEWNAGPDAVWSTLRARLAAPRIEEST